MVMTIYVGLFYSTCGNDQLQILLLIILLLMNIVFLIIFIKNFVSIKIIIAEKTKYGAFLSKYYEKMFTKGKCITYLLQTE